MEDTYDITPYNYVLNNPIMLTDPTGMSAEPPPCIATTIIDPNKKIIYHKDDDNKNIYQSNGYTSDGNTDGMEVVGQEKPGMDYSVGRSVLFGKNGDGEHITANILASGAAEMNSDIEMFILETITGKAVFRIGSFLFKPVLTKSGKYILKLVGRAGKGAGAGNNVVYHSIQNGITQYVGITNDLARRAAEHLATKGINIQPLMQGLSRVDARAVEQALIEINGLAKNGGTLLNKINSISPTNPVYSTQLQRGLELLESIGY